MHTGRVKNKTHKTSTSKQMINGVRNGYLDMDKKFLALIRGHWSSNFLNGHFNAVFRHFNTEFLHAGANMACIEDPCSIWIHGKWNNVAV